MEYLHLLSILLLDGYSTMVNHYSTMANHSGPVFEEMYQGLPPPPTPPPPRYCLLGAAAETGATEGAARYKVVVEVGATLSGYFERSSMIGPAATD